MAQPKNLKKLTRARMERTGESYTTARRAILDNRPERAAAQRLAQRQQAAKQAPVSRPEPEELPEYPAPSNVQQYDAALWHRVLTQAGVTNEQTGAPLSEALLFGLGGGIGFMLHSFMDRDALSIALVTRAHPEPLTATLLERCGAKVRIRTTGNAQAAVANLDAGLDQGRAVVVRVARAALPWVDTADVDAADTIDVAVLGEMHDALLVDEGGSELQLISPDDLATARSRHKREKNYCAWVPSRRSPDPQQLAGNALAAMTQATDRMLGHGQLPGMPAHFARNFGVAGLRQWADRLTQPHGESGWSTVLADPQLRQSAHRQFGQFLGERRFAAPDGFRGLFARFLTEASALPGLAPVADHAAAYRQLAERWRQFTDDWRTCLQTSPEPGQAARLGQALHDLARAEEQAATALAATCTALAKN